MVKEILLSRGKVAIVDDDDYERLIKFKWVAVPGSRTFYALSGSWNGKNLPPKGQYLMHRFIMDAPPGKVVDHINHDGLDNQKENLRLCTVKENARNSLSKAKKNKYKGIHFDRIIKKYVTQINCNGVSRKLGIYDNPEDAALRYDLEAKNMYGDYACINNIKTNRQMLLSFYFYKVKAD